MSVNILGFVLQSFWFKTAGFILTLFSPAQRVQAGSLWKHRAEKPLCYSSQPTPAFRAIVPCHSPRPPLSGKRGWGRTGDGFGGRVICPVSRCYPRDGGQSPPRHSGVTWAFIFKGPELGREVGTRTLGRTVAAPAGLQAAAVNLGCSGGLCQLP